MNKKKVHGFVLLLALAVIVLIPVAYMLVSSFVAEQGGFSLMAYYNVLLAEPGYLNKFWRSIGLSLTIAAGQTLVGCLAGTAFAKYRFAGRKFWFILMALFMILPIQVTLVPNYILLEKLNFLNSWKALIIPAVFTPFGTVWMTFVFQTLPGEWLEAASLDGAGKVESVFRIMIPAAKPGVVTLFVLSFVESWNMVEQPITFLGSREQYPLSVFLASVNESSQAIQSVCGILCLLPVMFLFFYYNEELVEGIGDAFWG